MNYQDGLILPVSLVFYMAVVFQAHVDVSKKEWVERFFLEIVLLVAAVSAERYVDPHVGLWMYRAQLFLLALLLSECVGVRFHETISGHQRRWTESSRRVLTEVRDRVLSQRHNMFLYLFPIIGTYGALVSLWHQPLWGVTIGGCVWWVSVERDVLMAWAHPAALRFMYAALEPNLPLSLRQEGLRVSRELLRVDLGDRVDAMDQWALLGPLLEVPPGWKRFAGALVQRALYEIGDHLNEVYPHYQHLVPHPAREVVVETACSVPHIRAVRSLLQEKEILSLAMRWLATQCDAEHIRQFEEAYDLAEAEPPTFWDLCGAVGQNVLAFVQKVGHRCSEHAWSNLYYNLFLGVLGFAAALSIGLYGGVLGGIIALDQARLCGALIVCVVASVCVTSQLFMKPLIVVGAEYPLAAQGLWSSVGARCQRMLSFVGYDRQADCAPKP